MMQVRFAVDVWQAKLHPQIDDRNDFAAEIDHAAHILGHPGNGSNFEQTDNFPHLQDRNAISTAIEDERQIFSGSFT